MELAFAQGDSLIHRLDPRTRILSAAVFSALVAMSSHLAALALALATGMALVGLARLKLSRLLWQTATVNGFLLMLWLILPFATPGEIVGRIGPLSMTRDGLMHALAITLKCNAIVLVCISLLATMDIIRLGHALHHLGAPGKLVHIFLFAVRYFDILHREYHRLVAAMRVRCFRPRTDRHTCRAYGHLIGMLLVRSLDRSERVMDAMKCRGFKGEFYVLRHFIYRSGDLVFACGFSVLIILLALVQWTPLWVELRNLF